MNRSAFLLVFIINGIFGFNLKTCRAPLGMQSGDINDASLSASSSFDVNSVGAKHARIRTEIGGGAWCPATQITVSSYEYLEIDLHNLTVITMVEIQGRFGNGQGQEYAEYFMMDYKRENGNKWLRYRDRNGETILKGNTNTYTAEIKDITPPIIAKRIRFIPYSKLKRTVCLRVELYGCPFEADLLSYQAPQGYRKNDFKFIDNTYDGVVEDTTLKDGLGQLTDGLIGDANPIKQSYEWIGWKQQSQQAFIPILFKFNTIRNFTQLLVHTSNMYTKDIQSFGKMIVQFSMDGQFSAKTDSITFNIDQDLANDTSRHIKLNLNNKIAKYINLKIYFKTKWLFVSEIEFKSSVANKESIIDYYIQISKQNANEDYQDMSETTGTVAMNTTMDTIESTTFKYSIDFLTQPLNDSTSTTPLNVLMNVDDHNAGLIVYSTGGGGSTDYNSFGSRHYLYFLISFMAAVFLIGIFLFILILCLRLKKYQSRCHLDRDYMYAGLPPQHKLPLHSTLQSKYLMNTYGGSGGGGLKTSTLNGHVRHQLTSMSSSTASSSTPSTDITQTLLQAYHTLQPSIDTQTTDYSSRKHYYTTAHAADGLVQFLPQYESLNGQNDQIPPLYYEPSPYDTLDTVDDVPITIASGSIQGVCGNSTYFISDKMVLLSQTSLNDNLQKYTNIDVSNVLLNGEYGKIVIVKSENKDDNLIAIGKMLDASSVDTKYMSTMQTSFIEEVSILSRISHPNLSNMIGYCEMPYCIITEYSLDSHLDEFIKTMNNRLSYNIQLHILSQITCAMKYLEQLCVIHPDLSLRNCIITNIDTLQSYDTHGLNSMQIKLTDIAICLNKYRNNYYTYKSSILLPIRYMPAESIFQAQFSSASNVWSFGIMTWQLFTFCNSIPFSEWSNNDYLLNLKTAYVNTTTTVLDSKIAGTPATIKKYCRSTPSSPFIHQTCTLNHARHKQTQNFSSFIMCCLNMVMPINCTKEMYDLMIECCHMNVNKRPKFYDIDTFLRNKINSTYKASNNYTVAF